MLLKTAMVLRAMRQQRREVAAMRDSARYFQRYEVLPQTARHTVIDIFRDFESAIFSIFACRLLSRARY